ncbi:MAG: HAD family hydrolase [Candidatus Kariarchaeaceae archaeon]
MRRRKRVIKGILFDFDGTLSDFAVRWIEPIEKTLLTMREDMSIDVIRSRLKEAFPKIIRASTGNSSLILLKITWTIGRSAGLGRIETIQFIRKLLKDKEAFKNITPFLETGGTIQALKHMEYKLALVTTASNSTIEHAFEKIPELTSFDSIVTRDSVKKTKPDPSAVNLAISELNLTKEECIMVGDMPVDLMAGKSAGCRTILTIQQWEKELDEQHYDQLMSYSPDIVVRSLEDIVNLAQLGFPVLD